jgi:uncharacterized membrane protein
MTHSPRHAARGTCALSGIETTRADLTRLDVLRPQLIEMMRRDHPELPDDALVSRDAIARYRARFAEELLSAERGELSALEREVTQSIAREAFLADDVEKDFTAARSIGDRLADHLATFGGSWSFIIAFGIAIVIWMAINASLAATAFDPYPFILLNLVLSCLAALQAPVIMMSQRRQEARDRLRAQHDYKVNLKAELEIRQLHDKVDHLIVRQWERLAELQRLQIEIMQDIAALRGK